MPRNLYWEIYLHLVWRTKESRAFLSPIVEPQVHRYLVHRALKTTGVIVHAIGGGEDHVHMAVSVPPTVELSKWVGDLKGACAFDINHGPCGQGTLAWQTGYGVVSFGKKDLKWVVRYIENQREHHAKKTQVRRLERIEVEEECG